MTDMDALRAFLEHRGRLDLLDSGLLAAHDNGTLAEFLDDHGAGHLPDAGLTKLLTAGGGFELDYRVGPPMIGRLSSMFDDAR